MTALQIDTVRARWSWLTVVVALNALAIVLVAVGLHQLYTRTLREAQARSQNIALATDQHLANVIARVNLSLQGVADELDHYLSDNPAQSEPLIRRLIKGQKAALPEAEAWSIVDRDGNLIFHEGENGGNAISVADRDYFTDLRSGRATGLAISKPIRSRLTGEWILVIARAIRDETNRFNGAVVVPLRLAALTQPLTSFELGPHDVVTIRDADNGLIARLPMPLGGEASPIGDNGVSLEFQSIVASGKKQATYEAVMPFDQRTRIASFRTLDIAPLRVIVAISKDDALAEWRHTAWTFATVVALLLLAGNSAAALFYRQWRKQRRGSAELQETNALLESALHRSRERDDALNAAQAAGLLGTYTLNFVTGRIATSPYIDTILGIDASFPHTLDGWLTLIHPDDRETIRTHMFVDVIEKRGGFDREYRIVRPSDQQVVWVHGLGQIDCDAQGQPSHMRGTVQDVSARRSADERLQLAAEVFSNATQGLVITDRQGTILEVNPAFTSITGYSADEVRGRNQRILRSDATDPAIYATLWRDLVRNGRWDGEFTSRRKDGTTYVQLSRIFSIRDARGEVVRFAAIISDITGFKDSQRRLEYLAYHDDLTGLSNRARLTEHLRKAMEECRQPGGRLLGVCYIDLDGFGKVNEAWGQALGDRLLVAVAQRLSACVGDDGIVARLGGDEFVVVVNGLANVDDVRAAADRLLETSHEPYRLDKATLTVGLSVGISVYPFAGVDEPDALLRQADQAMYEAKRRGKNTLNFFDARSEQRLRERQQDYDRLVEALAAQEFRLHYQPKVSLHTGQVIGVEALLRWQHPERGLLPPLEFLPLVEGSELTVPLGEWILREALEQQRRWTRQGLAIGVSVNIFGHHLQRADFVDRLAALLRDFPGLPPGTLDLEVLETTALENLAEVTARIDGCRQLGVRFSLDDFGTGYSSLAYLRQLPVHDVKIDRSFVRDMLENPGDQALVESIVNMAHTLGRQVVAEGVESPEHIVLLRRLGCDFAQGYGIARPMPAQDVPAWAVAWSMPDRCALDIDVNGPQ